MAEHQMINSPDTITGDKPKIKDGVKAYMYSTSNNAAYRTIYDAIDVGRSFFQNSPLFHTSGTSNLYPTL
jgi:hypothetical protein